ncbi:MAG: hypothetical protein ACK4NP_07535 [Parvularculaceae bacterium]
MSLSVVQFGLLAAGTVFLAGGAVLAILAARLAAAGRAALAEADARLAASQELAAEVKHLGEKIEQLLAARDAAFESAFLRHNEACMASMQSALAAQGACAHGTADEPRLSGGHHDDEDDDDHQKGNAARDEQSRTAKDMADADEEEPASFFARLFRRRH